MTTYSKKVPVYLKIETFKNLVWEVGFYDLSGDWNRECSKYSAADAQAAADALNVAAGFPTR